MEVIWLAVRSNSMLKLADTATTIKPLLLAITIRLPYLVTIAATEIAVVDFDSSYYSSADYYVFVMDSL